MLEFIEKIPNSKKDLWKCNYCGTIKPMRSDSIKAGITKSCGCQKNISKIKVPANIRRTFTLMKYRCENEKSSDFKNYGGRGIKLLYKDYNEFYKDVGDKPDKYHSIDRIDVNKNYEIGNCRWAIQKTQANNKTNNNIIKIDNEIMTIAEASEKYNIKYTTLRYRLKKWKDIKLAIYKDININKSHNSKKKEV